jgi:hypothetical protein
MPRILGLFAFNVAAFSDHSQESPVSGVEFRPPLTITASRTSRGSIGHPSASIAAAQRAHIERKMSGWWIAC